MAGTYGIHVFRESWLLQMIRNALQIVSPNEFAHDYAFEIKQGSEQVYIMNFLAIATSDVERFCLISTF